MSGFRVLGREARSILSPTSGFIREAGFSHSLTPAQNCTYGCSYCYVPTLRVFGGLKREDWERWGKHTTFKRNAAELLSRELRSGQKIYCSPLVDPYQPAERGECLMPSILQAAIEKPPAVFVIQTRGTLILRDTSLLSELSHRTSVRVSFSITTDCDEVRRLYEPHCEANDGRLDAVRALRVAGIEVYATLAPLLPCRPERLAERAVEASGRELILDPLHGRATKPQGATTREAAVRIARVRGHEQWLEAGFQAGVLGQIRTTAQRLGVDALSGVRGFALLAR